MIGKTIVAPLLLLSGVVGVAVPTLLVRSQTVVPSATTQQSQGTGTVTSSGSSGAKTAPKDDKGTFTISGTATSLVPGTSRPLTITITNPNSWDIDVMSITTSVTSPGANCPASSLVVPPYTYVSGPAVTAPGKGSTTMTLTAQFVDSPTANQSGCNGATFPLTFTGTAEKSSKK